MNTLCTLEQILVRDYGVAANQVTPDATLESLGLDSLSMLELMFKIEDRYGLKITEDMPTDMQTVGDVVVFVDGLITRKPELAALSARPR
jgi:acyl carrier protein